MSGPRNNLLNLVRCAQREYNPYLVSSTVKWNRYICTSTNVGHQKCWESCKKFIKGINIEIFQMCNCLMRKTNSATFIGPLASSHLFNHIGI